ncbi:hypothetical protein N749_11735 [Legionella pneumophila str. Leg01/20]|nr:hypothetical protein N749_11735 [Legionella pneumophila str. Leg01/20]
MEFNVSCQASRRCYASPQPNGLWILTASYIILIQSPHQINLKQGIKNQSFAIDARGHKSG